eukprot:CAMPEP_0115837778 /NCGR_PEP_ID=MMETSP0287-20121206/5392_1 /TAXON_ID=412157 /ORGANISM="Chrysochromulina rotalis, Strain UIO044" /LENGTH=136 /DNA_ID=CAMNT_0003291291 /DNA_START=144 /DNA_END=555 /DNA_ORIENTATION=+
MFVVTVRRCRVAVSLANPSGGRSWTAMPAAGAARCLGSGRPGLRFLSPEWRAAAKQTLVVALRSHTAGFAGAPTDLQRRPKMERRWGVEMALAMQASAQKVQLEIKQASPRAPPLAATVLQPSHGRKYIGEPMAGQ